MNLLRDPVLKENPFRVPEGYFEGFAKRLEEEMKRQEADPALRDPVRLQRDPVRLRRIAIAAAIAGLALLSWPLSRIILPSGSDIYMEELALMESAGLYYNDYDLASGIYEEEEMDDEEAFASLASDYLAMDSPSLDLYLELE